MVTELRITVAARIFGTILLPEPLEGNPWTFEFFGKVIKLLTQHFMAFRKQAMVAFDEFGELIIAALSSLRVIKACFWLALKGNL